MADSMVCPGCRRETLGDGLLCSSCGRSLGGASSLPPGPRLVSLMDALPAEDDRFTTQMGPPRRPPEPAPTRPKLHVEVIDSPDARARSKGGVALKIGLGVLCFLGGGAWFVGGLSLGMFFKYPIVLLIAGVGLVVDGLRRKER